MTAFSRRPRGRTDASGTAGQKVEQRDFSRVQWLAVLLPTLAIGLFEFLRHQWLAHALPGWLGTGWLGNMAGTLVVATIVFGFVRFFASILRRLTAEAAQAREEAAVILERQRIAREMHDGMAQALFYLGVKLRVVESLMSADADLRDREELRAVGEEVQDTHRHGHAQRAEVRLKTTGEGMYIEVSDDGAGFDLGETPSQGHYGLAIMEERAQMVKGELRLSSAPGFGTQVTVHLPQAAL